MEMNGSISVVIPTHKARERTLRCLAALWLCEPQPDEVIVVDDGSDDNTAHSVLRKYPRHIVVRLPTRRGFAAAANHGLSRASSEVLLLLDNRTELDPPAIGAILQAFEAKPGLGVAGAALRHPNGRRSKGGGRIPGSLASLALGSGLFSIVGHSRVWRWLRSLPTPAPGRVDWISGAALAVRRSLWNEIGPFDLGYRLRGQYIDLCSIASDAGWAIEIIPDFTAVHPANEGVARDAASEDRVEEEMMWIDLMRFAGKRNGNPAARQSGRALRLGGQLRLLGRRMATPLVPRESRDEWRAHTLAYRNALRDTGVTAAARPPAAH